MSLKPEEREAIESGVKAALNPVHELIIRMFGPLADQVGDILGDQGKQFRAVQLIKTLEKTKRMAQRAGVEIHVVPPRILLPAVHFATLEDNEAMQEKWAALLVNSSANPDVIGPSFPDVLHSLTPEEARFLDSTFENGHPVQKNVAPSEIVLDNLQRLGLLRRVPAAEIWVNSEPIGNEADAYVISAFGKAFIVACRPPE